MKIELMNKERQVVNIFLFLLLWGCHKPYDQVEDKIFKDQINKVLIRAKKLKNNEVAFFRMDTLTKFKWDKMYIFAGEITSEKMDERLGFTWNYSSDMGFFNEGDKMIVFVEKKEVVSSVYFIEGDKNYTAFEIGGMGDYTPAENSLFSIDKKTYHDGGFILQIVHPQQENTKITSIIKMKKKVKLK
jgi:hypothetical protein